VGSKGFEPGGSRESAPRSAFLALSGDLKMINFSCSAAVAAASALARASRLTVSDLKRGQRIDAVKNLRSAMAWADASEVSSCWY